MSLEIERKFLLKNDHFIKESTRCTPIVQGFLSTDVERVVRIRLAGDHGYITVKGKSTADGTSRFEWEKEINKAEATALLRLAKHPIIEKNRYEVPVGKHCFEIDVFSGVNEGLSVAEIELSHPEEPFVKPSWLGDEVTGQVKYYNAQLIAHPYSLWKK